MADTTENEVLELAIGLKEMRKELDKHWDATAAGKDRDLLQEQYDELDRQTMRLISGVVKAKGVKYDKAVTALTEANKKLEGALEDEKKFIAAVNKAAGALKLVGQVTAMVV